MQTYKIIIETLADPSEVSEINYNQTEIDNLLFTAAPYDEALLRKNRDDISLIDIYSISIETDGEFYCWVNKYYPEETYTLMVAAAIQEGVISKLNDILSEC
jgi:uncharacterized membrane protein